MRNCRPLSIAGANTAEGDEAVSVSRTLLKRASFIIINELVLTSVSDGESERYFPHGETIRFIPLCVHVVCP